MNNVHVTVFLVSLKAGGVALNLTEATQAPGGGGTVRIVDSTKFTISTAIAMADVTIEPGAIRELHVRVYVLTWLRNHTDMTLTPRLVAPHAARMELLPLW